MGYDRVAEVAREHRWHPPKSFDSEENFKSEPYLIFVTDTTDMSV